MLTKKRQLIAVAMTCLFAAAALSSDARQPGATVEYQLVTSHEGYFRCQIPRGWSSIRDEREDARVHCHGFYVYGPDEMIGVPPVLSIDYFAPDNTVFKGGLKGYLDRQFRPSLVAPREEKTSAVSEVMIDGRVAQSFTRDTIEFFPPDSLDMKTIPVRYKYYVLPHRDGFIKVRFSAPTESFTRWEPVLGQALETLQLWPRHHTLEVRATLPGLSLEETESAVTKPLTAALDKLANAPANRSVTRPGESVVSVDVPAKWDLGEVSAAAELRLAAIRGKLRDNLGISYAPPFHQEAILLVALYAKSNRPRQELASELATFAENVLFDRVRAVPGVAQVQMLGDFRERVEVVPAADKLAVQGIGMQEFLEVLRGIVAAHRDDPVRLEDLGAAVVAHRNGAPVFLRDIAAVGVRQSAGSEPGLWLAETSQEESLPPVATILEIRTPATKDPAAVFRAVAVVLDELRYQLPDHLSLASQVFTAFDLKVTLPQSADVKGDEPKDIAALAADFARIWGVNSVWRCDPLQNALVQPQGANGELFLGLEPHHHHRREQIMEEARNLLGDKGNVAAALPAPFGKPSRTTVAITGQDLVSLYDAADTLKKRLEAAWEQAHIQINPWVSTSLRWEVDVERCKRFGISSQEVAEVVHALVDGRPLGDVVLEGGRRAKLTVAADRAEVLPLEQLRRLPLSAPEGHVAPLSAVTTVLASESPSCIYHRNGQRVVLVSFDLSPKEPTAFYLQLTSILESLDLPPAIHVQFNDP